MGVAARSITDVMAELLGLLPTGWAIAQSTDAIMALFLLPLAAEIARFEAQAVAQLIEVDPGQAQYLLADYERVLGPDPYGRVATTQGQRQAIASQRWTARGGQSIAYFVGLAALLGVTITISERAVTQCGRAFAGNATCQPTPNQFLWDVFLPTSELINSFCGASQTGTASCGFYTPNPIVPVIVRDAPAHTTPVFHYAG